MGSISRCGIIDPKNIDAFNYNSYFHTSLVKKLKQLFQLFFYIFASDM